MLIKACINEEARDVRPCLFGNSRNFFVGVCAFNCEPMHFNCLSSIELVFFGRLIDDCISNQLPSFCWLDWVFAQLFYFFHFYLNLNKFK